ncbi:MAG TPA: PLP-dependent transferase [Anaerolineales bacterium]|nr:PLP-dependent transferase [Anaerolineales bacterium]
MTNTYSPGVQEYIQRGEALTSAEESRRAAMRAMKFDTIAVHGLYGMEAALANQGSIIEPTYLSSAQHFENSNHMEAALAYLMPAWAYSRVANPTQHFLEETLALLEGYGYEGATSACVIASGMAAVFMATNPFLSGSRPMNIVASVKCYGGTFTLFEERYGAERGVEIRWVRDPLNLEEWAGQIDENTRFLYGELPSNPGLAMLDVAAVAAQAHEHGCPLIVDSTVATPALLRPLCYGADIVVHSLSKTITSSGMAIAGALIARHDLPSRIGPDEMREDFARYVKLHPGRDHGPGLSPFSATMIMNDLRTLRSKMDLFSRNTMQVARFLSNHPQVETALYPGLESMRDYALAAQQMWLVDGALEGGAPLNRYGHLMGFTVRGGAAAARATFDRLQLIWRATDLGRIKSIATIPAISTHQQQGKSGRELAEVPDHLIRLSVGGEHFDDIIADLDRALTSA